MVVKAKKHGQNFLLFLSCLVLAVGIFLPTNYANAQSEPSTAINCDEYYDYISTQDIRGDWNPCAGAGACSAGGGGITGAAPDKLSGKDQGEKVWNYLTGRGLTPIAAAGVMGNLNVEAPGFDPWVGEGNIPNANKEELDTGYGIIQWTNTGDDPYSRRYKVMKYMEDNGVPLVYSTPPSQDEIDNALLLQLNWLWDGESGATWQEPVNGETTVEGNTHIASFNGTYADARADSQVGNGSTMLFHALIERSNDVPTEAERKSGAGVLTHRIDGAKEFLELYGAGGGECSVGEGGLTLDQANKLMEFYKTDPEAVSIAKQHIGQYCSPGDTDEGWVSNCTAFTEYFINKFTDLQRANGFGATKAQNLIDANPGISNGNTPKPFAVFSYSPVGMTCSYTDDKGNEVTIDCGHTGVILGVNGSEVIIGEAACERGYSGIKTRTISVEEATGFTYMYTDGHVDNTKLMGVIGG